MTRRIDIELTSDRGDGTWTWRSAGAKQPKGTLDASTLFDGAAVGDVCRADADFAMDGIFIEAVLPPKGRSGRAAEEQILLTGGTFEGGVTTTWKDRKGRDGDRKGGRGGERGRGKGRGPGDRGGRERGRKRDGDSRDGGRREGSDTDEKRGQRRDGDDRGRGRRDDRKRDGRNERGPRPDDRPRPKKLRPGRVHRSAWIETLAEEHKVVAETLSRGGIQAVRKEIDTQNEKAKSDGTSPIDGSPLIALAEDLLPHLRRAEWRDRADAALGDIGEIDLKDLRSVVVAADDAAKDEENLEVAEKLRTGLRERVEAAQTEWVAEIASTLSDGRVVRALRLSSRPPKAGALMPGDLLQRLTETANEAVKGDVTQQRLATLLDAVSRSVVRPNFVLETVPEKPTDELIDTVKKVAAQLPDVAAKFGVTATRRPRRGARKSAKKRPPKPTAPAPAPEGDTAPEAETATTAPEAPAAEPIDSVAKGGDEAAGPAAPATEPIEPASPKPVAAKEPISAPSTTTPEDTALASVPEPAAATAPETIAPPAPQRPAVTEATEPEPVESQTPSPAPAPEAAETADTAPETTASASVPESDSHSTPGEAAPKQPETQKMAPETESESQGQ